MGNNFNESTATISLHLDGESEIDASLLANTISNTVNLVEAAVKSENPDAGVKINVKAFENGSFEVVFATICSCVEAAQNLFSIQTDLAMLAINTLMGYFTIKNHLKGELPQKVADKNDMEIEVKNISGNTIVTPKHSIEVTTNLHIDQYVTNIAGAVKSHSQTGGFSLKSKSGETYFSADDVEEMRLPFPAIRKQVQITAQLSIRKPDLLGNSRWGFQYNGKNIDAQVNDEDFLGSIRGGETITAGDYIYADLEILATFDSQGREIPGTEKYTVTKVIGGIQHAPDIDSLFDE